MVSFETGENAGLWEEAGRGIARGRDQKDDCGYARAPLFTSLE